MRYPVMSAQPQYVYKSAVPDGGINQGSAARAEKYLDDGENMWLSDGLLCTRPGLAVEDTEPIYSSGLFDAVSRPLTFTGARVTIEGEEKELAYYTVSEDGSHIKCYVCLVGGGTGYTSIGTMNFNRISSDTFFTPQRFLFFSAGATYGCGIYAFVTVSDGVTTEYSIYECNAERDGWQRISNSDYYIPTVYINGRGTLYDEVNDAYPEEPIELEQQNLLTGEFKAYFSSDGHSSTFQLPLSGLDSSNVICRIYRTPTQYAEWIVEENESEAAADFFGVEVTLSCDRVSGMLHFTSGGTDHPIMRMAQYRGNNIFVYASKTIENGFARVVGASVCESFNSFIVLSGSEADKNAVTAARTSRPLYFPKGAVTYVGGGENAVTALKAFGNRLLCFKADGIYRITLNDGSTYADNELLVGVENDFYKSDTLKNELLYYRNGCSSPQSICVCGNELLWLDASRNVCVMKNGSSRIYTVSDAVFEDLNELSPEDIKACCYKGCYLLWAGNRVLAAQLNESPEKTAWYKWKFSDDITVDGVAVLGGVPKAAVRVPYKQWSYIAVLAGAYDILPDEHGEVIRSSIPAFFATARYDLGCPQLRKAIDTVFIEAAASQSIEISFGNEEKIHRIDIMMEGDRAERRQTASFRVRPRLYGVCDTVLTVRSDGAFSAGGLMFCYRKLSEAAGV